MWEEAKRIWAATPLAKPNLALSKLGSESSQLLSSRIYIFCLFISSGIKLGSRIGASVYRSMCKLLNCSYDSSNLNFSLALDISLPVLPSIVCVQATWPLMKNPF